MYTFQITFASVYEHACICGIDRNLRSAILFCRKRPMSRSYLLRVTMMAAGIGSSAVAGVNLIVDCVALCVWVGGCDGYIVSLSFTVEIVFTVCVLRILVHVRKCFYV